MDIDEKLSLVTKLPTQEIVTTNELKNLLQTVSRPKHYIGLEISGFLHLGSLIVTGYKLNDLIKAGFKTTVFLADWHTFINNKLSGDWQKIKDISEYYSNAFKFFCPGVDILLGSDLYEQDSDYWKNFMKFCKHITLSRTMRSLTIMGRSEKDNLDFSQFLYPAMQSTDIHSLDLDMVHAGMDQRKIHMLVREIFPKLKWKVPVCLHHHLLPGLTEPTTLGVSENDHNDAKISSKMSKSKPIGSILIHDDFETINNKISKAFCPVGISENNPILELLKYVIFQRFSEFTIERPSKYGGNISYYNYDDLERDYKKIKIHPLDLKKSVSFYLNEIISPIREHFKGNEPSLN
ncbi:MAG: tyrosine--tRNA ligase [Nitrososphaeraceae archaeon]